MGSKVPFLLLRTSLTISKNAAVHRSLANAHNIVTPAVMSQLKYNKLEIERRNYCSAQDSSDAGESSSSESAGTVDDIKSAVLDAALEHVHQLGWSKEAIAKGAESLGYSSMSNGIVESGGAELFVHLQKRCNEELEEVMEEWHNASQVPLKWSVAVEKALSRRLLMVAPYRNIWAQGLASVSLSPSLIAASLQNSLSMADSVCYYAGDRSTQAEWYYHRAAVLAMYKASELSLLQDNSPEFEETLQFLHRRVHQVESLGCSIGSTDGVAAEGVKVASAVGTMIGNILGLRNTSRK